ncbi:MAG: transcription-repair coupling factor [Acholeplasmatales bacterium]|nr:transcription-repair coupling factor [Acholeplasmatales bacterium]
MDIFEYLKKLNSFNTIITSDNLKVGQSSDGFNQMVIGCDHTDYEGSIFVVLPSLFEATKYYDALCELVGYDDVLFFPGDEVISSGIVSTSGDFLFERIETIYSLINNPKKIVVTNMYGIIKYELNKDIWTNSFFTLKKGMEISIDHLINDLVRNGYKHVYQTIKTGEFARRGSIVDIFPLGYNNPIRIDFFDDEIDEIKEFNFETQRSISKVDNVLILPVEELIYTAEDFSYAKDKILAFIDNFELSKIEEEVYNKDLFNLENHDSLGVLSRYVPFFDESKSTILDFSDNKRLYIIDPIKSLENYRRLLVDLDEYAFGNLQTLSKMDICYNFEKVLDMPAIKIEGLRNFGVPDFKVYSKNIDGYKGRVKQIVGDLKTYRKSKLVISFNNENRAKRLADVMDEEGVVTNTITDFSKFAPGVIYILYKYLPSFYLESEDLYILNESTIYDTEEKKTKARFKSIYKNAKKITSKDELHIGDYVVHYDYGIGKYLGIETLKLGGLSRDLIHVMYANNTALYIPLEKISNLMKYASYDVEGIMLHEIGGTSWARLKSRVRKRIHDISDELIALYAKRNASTGFKFPPDSEEQISFERDFEHELTKDQETALRDIKHDMESEKPMDRLVCGDVGYGKTEVALRAAFKAVYGGKQVAVLAPTTILARQHYQTFKSRMEEYGVRVEMLSRFVSTGEQNKIIDDVKRGSVDVLIGTHRILSTEIVFKDLGLLIIDEEQRFGVTHKERIKEMKVNVDCITLTATPIPRTLQMSMMGIKDLSMIETPPKDRYPIQTYVIERNDRVIQDAILKEMARGGQVFYLYNYTETIIDMKEHLQSLVPEARICIGHGKLKKEQLENTISKFIDGKYDVLLCTTIIETGIDMPRTNTLIIHDSDRLGLSQLYQIRGRVGRSNKIAYAYLMYEPRKELTVEAEKRLSTIKEFNELGSGYKIAMRDLSIRGAGDILGEEQSGFIESVGIDMYLKILDEEVNHKAPPKDEEIDKSLVLPIVNRTIDRSYIESDDQIISLHKKIAELNSLKELNELEAELLDRFGEPPLDIISYMYEKLMDNYCKKLGIYRIDRESTPGMAIYHFSKEVSEKLNGQFIFETLGKDKDILLAHYDKEVLIKVKNNQDVLYTIKHVCEFFNKIDNEKLYAEAINE